MAKKREGDLEVGVQPQGQEAESDQELRSMPRSAPDPDRPGVIYHITARVLVYAMLTTLLLACALCVFMGFLAWEAQREANDLRRTLTLAEKGLGTCRIALERADAKMELADQWVFGTRSLRGKPTATGGE